MFLEDRLETLEVVLADTVEDLRAVVLDHRRNPHSVPAVQLRVAESWHSAIMTAYKLYSGLFISKP